MLTYFTFDLDLSSERCLRNIGLHKRTLLHYHSHATVSLILMVRYTCFTLPLNFLGHNYALLSGVPGSFDFACIIT